jgi:hypothetical protein
VISKRKRKPRSFSDGFDCERGSVILQLKARFVEITDDLTANEEEEEDHD